MIAAATRLFVDQGYEATSIADISSASGVSNGSIFHHFGNKDGVAVEIFLKERRVYWDAIADAMTAETDPLDGIEAGLRAAFKFLQDYPKLCHFIVSCSTSDWLQRSGTIYTDHSREFMIWIMTWAAPYMAAGRLPKMHPSAFGAMLFGPSGWVTFAIGMDNTDRDPAPILEDLVQMTRKAFSA